MDIIAECTSEDVVLGRGSKISSHPGNIRFRELAKEKAPKYNGCKSKVDKKAIAKELVQEIESSGARFLRPITAVSKNDEDEIRSAYELVSNETKMTKAAQKLRECAASFREGQGMGQGLEALGTAAGIKAAGTGLPGDAAAQWGSIPGMPFFPGQLQMPAKGGAPAVSSLVMDPAQYQLQLQAMGQFPGALNPQIMQLQGPGALSTDMGALSSIATSTLNAPGTTPQGAAPPGGLPNQMFVPGLNVFYPTAGPQMVVNSIEGGKVEGQSINVIPQEAKPSAEADSNAAVETAEAEQAGTPSSTHEA